MTSALVIVAGYIALVVAFGWGGVAAVAAHVALMALCVPRK